MRITVDHGSQEFSDLRCRHLGSQDSDLRYLRSQMSGRRAPLGHSLGRVQSGYLSLAELHGPGQGLAQVHGFMVGWERGPIRYYPSWPPWVHPTRPTRTRTGTAPAVVYEVCYGL